MNREIKFRGKRIDNGEWVYGYYVGSEPDAGYRMYTIWCRDDEDINKQDWFEVDPDTVGQYTGLKDKNGKEIYEGDIVNTAMIYHGKPIEPHWNSKIVYNDHIGAWQIAYLNTNDVWVRDNVELSYDLEIIGNIFDNPELIEKNNG